MKKYNLKSLNKKLEDIDYVFSTDDLILKNSDSKYIQRYYTSNYLPYQLFYNRYNIIHMGISYRDKLRKEDFYEQARLVSTYIQKLDLNKKLNVLELASGRSENTRYLSDKYPNIEFTATDLTLKHIKKGKKIAKKRQNMVVKYADYHDLSKFPSNHFDLVFVVEALCHSQNKSKVLNEVNSVLKRGGFFIVIDGYMTDKKLTDYESLAAKLTEKGMAVQKFEKYSDFLRLIKKSNFDIEADIDWTQNIFPSLFKFEKDANKFFRHKKLARFIAKLVPKEFAYNSISGYLMYTLFKNYKLYCYHASILKKK